VNETTPIFSIITPVYNGESFIRETIESVLAASKMYDSEYIIIDDGSTDRTLEVLNSFGNRIRIVSQENSGESSAVNIGIKLSLGQFLLVVSADDPLLTPAIFENVQFEFERDTEVVAIYPDWQIINSKNQILQIKKVPEFSIKDFLGKNLVLPGPGTIFRKDAAIKVSGRDLRWRFVGDYDFWLRLSDFGIFKHRAKTLAQWRTHGASTSVSQRGPEMANERIAVIERYLEKTSVEHTSKVKRMALGNAYALAARLIYFDQRVPGKKFLWKAFATRRGWPERLTFIQAIYIVAYPVSGVAFRIIKRAIH